MQFGLFLNRQGTEDPAASTVFDGLVEQTRSARDAEFDLVVSGQHFLTDYTQLQTIPTLSRLSADAGSMTLATGVLLLPFTHPVAIAENLGTLDAIGDGDTIVGVGAGYRDVEFESFGVPKRERVPRVREGVELLARLFSEEDVTFHGEFYSVDGVTITPQPADPPPIWLAANSTPAVERAARLADAWFVNPHSELTGIAEQKERYDRIRAERGVDASLPLLRDAVVAETHEEAMDLAERYLKPKYDRYLDWGQDEAMDDGTELHQSFEQLRRNRFLIGTPEEVSEQLERFQERLDVSHLVLRMNWPGMPVERTCEAIELLGDEIIPDFRS